MKKGACQPGSASASPPCPAAVLQARALGVSHWEVNPLAAVKLSTAAIAALADRRASGRAEAMRQVMLSMIESGEAFEARSSNWAPFVVVGEGAGAEAGCFASVDSGAA